MTTETPTPEAPPGPATYPEIINRNIKAEVARAGHKPVAVEAAVGLSHAAASRRFNGELDWETKYIAKIADWLQIPVEHLSSTTR